MLHKGTCRRTGPRTPEGVATVRLMADGGREQTSHRPPNPGGCCDRTFAASAPEQQVSVAGYTRWRWVSLRSLPGEQRPPTPPTRSLSRYYSCTVTPRSTRYSTSTVDVESTSARLSVISGCSTARSRAGSICWVNSHCHRPRLHSWKQLVCRSHREEAALVSQWQSTTSKRPPKNFKIEG